MQKKKWHAEGQRTQRKNLINSDTNGQIPFKFFPLRPQRLCVGQSLKENSRLERQPFLLLYTLKKIFYKLIISLNFTACLLLTSIFSPHCNSSKSPPLKYGSILSIIRIFTICFLLARKNVFSSSLSSSALSDFKISGLFVPKKTFA